MTVKQFFKSTAFKCIIALLCVLLVSGVFLTIMHSLLEVSDEERLSRIMSSIYGKSVTVEAQEVENYNDNAEIKEVYLVKDDGNYLIKSTGKGGYNGGSVTCWVVVEITGGAVSGIGKVVVLAAESVGQTQITEINTNRFLNSFSTGYKNEEGFQFSPNDGFLVTGSTMSSRAVCNAVNGALDYANAKCGNVAVDIYKEYEFTHLDAINTRNTSHVVNSDLSVTYTVTTNGYGMASEFVIQITVGTDGKISEYKIVSNGSTGEPYSSWVISETWFVGKDAQDILAVFGGDAAYGNIKGGLESNDLTTNATNSSYLCIQAAVFATANYELCIQLYEEFGIGGGEAPEQPEQPEQPTEPEEPNFYEENDFEYLNYIDVTQTTHAVDGTSVTYTIVTKRNVYANPFTIEITVGEGGVITNFEIKVNGSTDNGEGTDYKDLMPAEFKDGVLFLQKTLQELLNLFGENVTEGGLESNGLQTGATLSSNLCLQAALFATANYEKCIELWELANAGGEGNE